MSFHKRNQNSRMQNSYVSLLIIGCSIALLSAIFVILNTAVAFAITGLVSGGALIAMGLCLYLKKNKRERLHQKKFLKAGLLEIDKMNGTTFEMFLQTLFESLGYAARLTKNSGDFGADLILKNGDLTVAVQAKCYAKKVGIKAVQEVVSAKSYYCAASAWVVTNNYFTQPAIHLANSNRVTLIDRDKLTDLIFKAQELQKLQT